LRAQSRRRTKIRLITSGTPQVSSTPLAEETDVYRRMATRVVASGARSRFLASSVFGKSGRPIQRGPPLRCWMHRRGCIAMICVKRILTCSGLLLCFRCAPHPYTAPNAGAAMPSSSAWPRGDQGTRAGSSPAASLGRDRLSSPGRRQGRRDARRSARAKTRDAPGTGRAARARGRRAQQDARSHAS